jgi:DNA repair protein RadC
VRIRELRVVYRSRSEPSVSLPASTISRPREAATIFQSLLGPETVEVFGVLCLTSRQHLLCYHELARGTLDAVAVNPRDVFKVALLSNAAGVIVGHNHPSGDPLPSPHDEALTTRLSAAGELIGVDVVDHVIVGDDTRYWSFREMGRL